MRRSTAVLLFLVFAAFVHMAIAYPELPERVPTHFGPSGEPDAWSSRAGAMSIYAGLVVFVAGFCWGLARLLPRMPNSLINVPHREVWLAPERREETLWTVSDVVVHVASATVALVIALMAESFRVASGHAEGLGSWVWGLIGAYLLFTLGLIPWMFRRFPASPGD